MRNSARLVATLGLLALLVLMALVPPAWGEGDTEDITIPPGIAAVSHDDEVVLIRSDGYIQVEDPFHSAGTDPATWTSPEGGWNFVTTGDFNGDGDDEIVALGGSRAKIYDPFPTAGTKVAFEQVLSGFNWVKAVAADIDADGRDELILLRDDNTATAKARLLVYDGNPAGTQWTLIQDIEFGAQWADMVAGNFIGDSRLELALTRQQVPTTQGLILVLNAQTGQTIAQDSFGYYFERIAAGDADNNGLDDIAAVRNISSVQGTNMVIFRVRGVGQGLESIYSTGFGTAFRWVSMADYDSDGADEVSLLRNVPPPHSGLYAVDRYGTAVNLNEVIGEGWTDLRSGDIDADGRSDVLILKDNLVRAYRPGTPGTSTSIIWSKSGSYRAVFATGDIDGGTGVITGPRLEVSPTSLTFTMEYGSSAPPAQTLTVTNATATGAISWTAQLNPQVDWLSIWPTSGQTPGTINVAVVADRVSAGTLTTNIVISGGAGVANSPFTVPVTVTVVAPTMQVTPNTINIVSKPGRAIPQRALRVTQAGGGAGGIHWYATVIFKDQWDALQAQANQVESVRVTDEGLEAVVSGKTIMLSAVEWLTIYPTHGTTPADIYLAFDTAGLALGTYRATVIVDGGAGVINRLGYCDVTLSLVDRVGALPLVVRNR